MNETASDLKYRKVTHIYMYHKDCMDGQASAWVIDAVSRRSHFTGDVLFWPVDYHESFDALAILAKESSLKFAIGYYDSAEGRHFSIRSDGIDMRSLARHYGGDGHAAACGFTIKRSDTRTLYRELLNI